MRRRIEDIIPEETSPIAGVVRDTYDRITAQIGEVMGSAEERPSTPRELVREGVRSLRAYVAAASAAREETEEPKRAKERAARLAELAPTLDEALLRFEEAIDVPAHYLAELADAYARRIADASQLDARTKEGRRAVVGPARVAARLYAQLGDDEAIGRVAHAVSDRDIFARSFDFQANRIHELGLEVKARATEDEEEQRAA